ncbi:hypothetical protein [Blastococcus sp. PRF04-17]|uniref:hypothetical protein n=1 Tax=Blastococcus sp. PRF04-17 TaxID=2933797 RepID=UPI001FF667A4|nr:hypothetical protein [Blastococcus sp. PRF04-17]UOY00804.1 hypothetical protein MVA48_17740 [Blastococcus sp. PRF04-17]
MHIRRAAAPLCGLAALALLLSGCSGSDGDDARDPAASEQESPLQKYLNAAYGGDLSPEEQEEKYAEQQRQIEELVAQCMQDEGFEYTPATDSGAFYVGDDTEWKPDDREWVSQYGYGAVNSPFGSPFDSEPVPEEEYVDPNADYVASLSESEQMAFYEALYGVPPEEEEMSEEGQYEYDWTQAGCQGAAQHEVAGEDPSQSEEFKPLFDAINDLYSDHSSWPGMAELDAEWASCMEDAGQGGHASPMEAQNSIHEEMNKLYESVGMPEEDATAAPEPDRAATEALAEREVELALADLDCREEIDYGDRQAEITRTVEQRFIDDHKAELDAMVASVEQN